LISTSEALFGGQFGLEISLGLEFYDLSKLNRILTEPRLFKIEAERVEVAA